MSNPRPIEQAVSADLRNSWIALLRSARRAREIAAQTGTAIVVVREGVLEHIYPGTEDSALTRMKEPVAGDGRTF